jgi:hypothetical protein
MCTKFLHAKSELLPARTTSTTYHNKFLSRCPPFSFSSQSPPSKSTHKSNLCVCEHAFGKVCLLWNSVRMRIFHLSSCTSTAASHYSVMPSRCEPGTDSPQEYTLQQAPKQEEASLTERQKGSQPDIEEQVKESARDRGQFGQAPWCIPSHRPSLSTPSRNSLIYPHPHHAMFFPPNPQGVQTTTEPNYQGSVNPLVSPFHNHTQTN